MVSNKTKARLGVKATTTVARNPALRRATIRARVPAAKVVVKRQMRNQMERIGPAARTAGSIVAIYGPMTAEALGLVEAPKPKRRAPASGSGTKSDAAGAPSLSRSPPLCRCAEDRPAPRSGNIADALQAA